MGGGVALWAFHNMYVMYFFAKCVAFNFGFHFSVWAGLGEIEFRGSKKTLISKKIFFCFVFYLVYASYVDELP